MPESAVGTGQTSRMASLAEDLRRRRTEVSEQRKELGVLIKQAASEIERLSQRAREAGSQLRQVESNLDSFTQADIKRAYAGAQEAQMRQFMMQNQLEQLRNRQTGLDSTDELLRQLIDAADGLVEAAEDASSAPTSNRTLTEAEQAAQARTSAEIGFRGVELALQRLSRQLQDEIAQTLSDLILRAEVCERLVDMDRQKAKTEVARLKQAASAALKSTRQVVQDLRSPALEEVGLSAALRRYVDSLKSSDKLQVELQIVGSEKNLPQSADIAIFRIVQEALANTARHSGTNRAEVRVRHEQDHVVVTVADEGCGFEVERALQQARAREQAGLTDMQLRAELAGGILEISSKPGNGCMISLALPS